VVSHRLLALFAAQHSVMARRCFKSLLVRVVPRPIERSTYVLASSLALAALFTFWEPIDGTVWLATDPTLRGALHALFAAGWLIVLVSTFLFDHFDLFGLKQVTFHLLGRPASAPRFATPSTYNFVRHPLYAGWLLAFWATPTMTASHLVFAAGTTVYILVAIRLEERDLLREHGEAYAEYRRRVPMLVPAMRSGGLRHPARPARDA